MEHTTGKTCGNRASRRRRSTRWSRRRGLAAVAAVTGLVTMVATACSTGSASTLASDGSGSLFHGAGAPFHGGSTSAAAGNQGRNKDGASSGLVTPPGSTAGRSSAGPAGTDAYAGVTGGALFGGDTPLAEIQSKLGRKLAIVRVYYGLGEKFPDQADSRLMAGGSTLLVSLDLDGKGNYASVYDGQHDATISAFLKAVDQSAVTYHLGAIYICFEHEADGPTHHHGLGSPADFVKAWDHIHALAVSMHLDWNQGGRLHWVLILTHRGYTPVSQRQGWERGIGEASQFWPGTGEVDVVAADGYNTSGCLTGKGSRRSIGEGDQVTSPAQIFGNTLAFAHQHGGLPVFIAEWGSVSYSSPNVQADYIHEMQAYVTGNPEIAATLYWDGRQPGFGCGYSVNNHPASLAALAAMGRAPALQGLVPRVG